MDLVIDLSAASPDGLAANPFSAMWYILTHGGWLIIIPVILWGGFSLWVNWRQNLYAMRQKYLLLAVDVPKENEQSPKAVEQIFDHLSGIQKVGNLKERFIDGYTQSSISLEIVSIEGYVQFLIRAPVKFRDLVEAAFYAQYPNAEITEVEDYSAPFKPPFPNEEFDIWGTEMAVTNKQYFPIRTYPSFEHSLSQVFFDPMANILEILSRVGRGEQVWFQIVIQPPSWKDPYRQDGLNLIKKLIGAKVAKKSRAADILWLPTNVAHGLYESAVASIVAPTGFGESPAGQEDKGPPTLMQHLAPHERSVVESIGIKLSKFAYICKIRLLYLGKHDVFDKNRVAAVTGALRQFNTLDMNGFMIDKRTKTSVDYFLVKLRNKWRKNRLLWNYKYRSNWRGRNRFMLNVEELATMYHFPVTTVVKAPRVQKTESKRSEPPTALPLEAEFQRTTPFAPGQPAVPSETELPAEAAENAAAPATPTVEQLPTITPMPLPTIRNTPPDNLPT